MYKAIIQMNNYSVSDNSQLAIDANSGNINPSSSTDLLVAKVVALSVLFCVTLFCGAVPYLLDRYFKWTKSAVENAQTSQVVQCLLYFGGGVLICTTLVHMLPEVIEVVEQLQQCSILVATPFALPEMLMCTGFFLMYMIEEIMHAFVHRHQKKLSENAFKRGCNSSRNSKFLNANTIEAATTTAAAEAAATTVENSIATNETATAIDDDRNSHLAIIINNTTNVSTSLRGLGLILALSLHELFEGLAIGLESSVGTVWLMFAAIAAHKLVLAFCVGMELLMARTRTYLAIIYLATFSIVTPIGVAIGIAISEKGDVNRINLPSGILQGIASGTLLYVVFFEILSKNHTGWRAYISALIGFILMFVLQVLSEESENDDPITCF